MRREHKAIEEVQGRKKEAQDTKHEERQEHKVRLRHNIRYKRGVSETWSKTKRQK